MESLDSLDLAVTAGRVKILSDGIGLAVKFDSAVMRRPLEPAAA